MKGRLLSFACASAVASSAVDPTARGRMDPGASDEELEILAAREARREAAAMAARGPIDLVEAAVAAGARSLVLAAERAAKVDLGPVGREVLAVAHGALEVDRALVRLADERARTAADGS